MKLKGLRKACTATKNISNGCEVTLWVNPETSTVDAVEVLYDTILGRGDDWLYVGTTQQHMTMDDIEEQAQLRLQLWINLQAMEG